MKKSKLQIKETIETIKDWIKCNMPPVVVVSGVVILISLASVILRIYLMIQYLIRG